MKISIRPFTAALISIGILSGACLSLLAAFWASGSIPNVLLLTVGSSLISTAFISLILDLFWSRERASAEKEELKPVIDQLNHFTVQLRTLEEQLEAFKKAGFISCHSSRREALERFLNYARQLVSGNESIKQEGRRRVNIVSSSARGLMGYLDREPESIQEQWKELIQKNPKSFRILLTHPAYAHLRQPAEERASGDIELEILKTAIYLYLVAGMRSDELRLYRGSPTVFAIQADTHILLNPYPYGQMALQTLSLEFDCETTGNYVSNFIAKHFNHTWAFNEQTSKQVDGRALVEGIADFSNILKAFGECTFLGNPRQLRLTKEQVQELDVFTRKTLASIPETKGSDASFIKYVNENNLCFSNPESGEVPPCPVSPSAERT